MTGLEKKAAIDIKQDPIQRTDRCMSRGVSEQASTTRVPGKRALCWHYKRGTSGFARLSRDDAQMEDAGDAPHRVYRTGCSLLCKFGAIARWLALHITCKKCTKASPVMVVREEMKTNSPARTWCPMAMLKVPRCRITR